MTLKITILATMLAFAGMATAQDSSEKYNASAEMQKQMQIIANGLKLDNARIAQLGGLMEEKRKQKEDMLAEINKLKNRMNSLEENLQKQLQGMLTAEEWAKYQNDIKPVLDENLEKRMEKIEK